MRFFLATVLSVVLAATSSPAAAEPKIYGKAVEVRKFSTAKLGNGNQGLFAEFQGKKIYFGAMYVNFGADQGSFYRGAASLEAAMRVAESRCEGLKGSGPGECVLYGLIVPKGFPKDVFKAFGVPQDGIAHYQNDFEKRAKKGRHAAYALSDLGYGGAAWEYDTAEEAAEAATLSCLSDVASELAKMDKRTRGMAQKRGYGDCPIVATRGP